MSTSIFIARLLGPLFLLVGLSLIAHLSFYRSVLEDFQRSRALLYLIGVLRLMAGLAVVLVHNLWVADWRVLITLIGWLAIVRGALVLVAPEAMLSWAGKMIGHDGVLPVVSAVAVVLGGALCFFGYF